MPEVKASRAEALAAHYLEGWGHGVLREDVVIGKMRHPVDPWLFAVLTGSLMGTAEPAEVLEMRGWSRRRWESAIDAEIDRRLAEMEKGLTDWLKAAARGIVGLFTKRKGAPPYLTEAEDANWQATKTRVGEHITQMNEQARATVRDMVRDAVAEGLSRSQLMMRLSARFKGQVRDWLRVARTEMQAAHNEAVAAATIERDGVVSLMAMVPEHDACSRCKALYLDSTGRPRVWSLSTLVDNGTNYGKKPDQWLATLHPLHPNCRCTPMRVPQGHKFNGAWALVPE